jgi:tetratricopeptide (TPR) repeat protein
LSETVSVFDSPPLEWGDFPVATRIAEFWFLLKARIHLMMGRRDRARAALKGALRRNPNSFVAHFLLGRVYWRDRSIVKAKREFDLAWQIDPERFEGAYGRLRAQHGSVPELFSYTGMRTEVEEVPVYRPVGDFRNEAERQRFDALPPITRDDILDIDWDRFEDEIYRDESL